MFVVRLRDDQGQVMPGVRICDNGPKAGLNGVDNGQIWYAAPPAPACTLIHAQQGHTATGPRRASAAWMKPGPGANAAGPPALARSLGRAQQGLHRLLCILAPCVMAQCQQQSCLRRTAPRARSDCCRFHHVRVPRDAMLDRYASVAPDGAYSSSIPSITARFGIVVGGLTNGAPMSTGPAGLACSSYPGLELQLPILSAVLADSQLPAQMRMWGRVCQVTHCQLTHTAGTACAAAVAPMLYCVLLARERGRAQRRAG